MSSLSALAALSPIDDRCAAEADPLCKWLSETAFIRNRVEVEVHWLIALSQTRLVEVPRFSAAVESMLLALVENFAEAGAVRIKEIEAVTNRDVKAVEYWMKERVRSNTELEAVSEFIHFTCTSEDVNNASHGMMLRGAHNTMIVPTLRHVQARLVGLVHVSADMPVLSHTHGQPVSPITPGKEMANVAAQLDRTIRHIETVEPLGKMNGAVGNYNAHLSTCPSLDWETFSRSVIETRLGPTFNPYTTQIEPHDYMAELFDAMARANTIILDLDCDVWGCISQDYLKQKTRAGEIGSSTMPYKVNPIDFEDSEGSVGLANAVLRHPSEKLPVSRWRCDLTDSTVLHSIGVAFGYSLLICDARLRGLGKLEANPARLAENLGACWEVLAEPVQTVMRRYGIANPYEQLKELTRDKDISREALHGLVGTLAVPKNARKLLLDMTPANYIGRAEELTRRIA